MNVEYLFDHEGLEQYTGLLGVLIVLAVLFCVYCAIVGYHWVGLVSAFVALALIITTSQRRMTAV